jgi:hypothetical protein
VDDSAVQSELSRLASSISALDRKLSDLDRKFGDVDRKLGNLSRQVGQVDDRMGSLARTVGPALSRLQSDISKLSDDLEHDRVVEDARAQRDELDSELEKFSPHEKVRKLADGIIYAVRTGVIDDNVILDTAQRRMVDLPDYWLAPAIVAVAAWLSRDEHKCAEAIDQAMRLDRSKTALFMTLLLRQHNRGHALQQWIDAYLNGLRSKNLPAEFEVVIAAVTGKALGDGAAPKLNSWMADQYLTEIQSRDTRAEAMGEWQERVRSIPTAAVSAPTLAASCPDWAALHERHAANLTIEAADRHFRGRFEAPADVPADLTERIRELVTKLAHTPDPEEDGLRRRRRLADAVTRTGDREEAQRRLTAEEAGRTGALNILSLVSASAFPPLVNGKVPAPTITERLTIVITRDLIASVADGLHDGTTRPTAVKVRVGRSRQWICTFSCATDEEVTSEALNAQAAALEAEVMDQIYQEIGEQQRKLRQFRQRPFPAAVGSALVIGAVPFLTGLPVVDFAAPAAVIAAGAGSRLAMLLRRGRQHGQSSAAREKAAISATLSAAASELAEFFAAERRGARLRTELPAFLRGLTPDDAYQVIQPVESPPIPQSRDFPDWTPLPATPQHPELSSPDRLRSSHDPIRTAPTGLIPPHQKAIDLYGLKRLPKC